MRLIEVFLPLYGNDGAAIPRERFNEVRTELTERFGGLTAFTRAPAEGLWKDEEARTRRDEIVIYEVMAESLNREWWAGYRRRLEARFGQDAIVIRASAIDVL